MSRLLTLLRWLAGWLYVWYQNTRRGWDIYHAWCWLGDKEYGAYFDDRAAQWTAHADRIRQKKHELAKLELADVPLK